MMDPTCLLLRLVDAVDREAAARARKGAAYSAYGKGGLGRYSLGAATEDHNMAKKRLDEALADARKLR